MREMIFCEICEAQLWSADEPVGTPETGFLCRSCDREVADGVEEDQWGKDFERAELADIGW